MGSRLHIWLIDWWDGNVSWLKLNWSIIFDSKMFRWFDTWSSLTIFKKSKISRNEISINYQLWYNLKKVFRKIKLKSIKFFKIFTKNESFLTFNLHRSSKTSIFWRYQIGRFYKKNNFKSTRKTIEQNNICSFI